MLRYILQYSWQFLLLTTLIVSASARADQIDIQEVRIGVVIPLTGPLAASAQAFRAASLLALEDARKSGKLRYTLIFEDDQLQSKNAATAAKKLIQTDRVSALVSTWSYGGSVIAPVAERSKVIHIGVAWAPQIAEGSFNFLNLSPPSSFAPALLEIASQRGFKTISTFGATESGSVFSALELERLAPSYGAEVISKTEVRPDETDFRSAITRELRRKPDVLYLNLIGAQLDTFMNQLRTLNRHIPVMIQTGLSTVTSLSPYEGYWYAAETYFPDQLLEERLVASIGHHNTLYAANFYDSIQILVQAFEQCAGEKATAPSSSHVLECSQSLSTTRSIFTEAKFDHDGVLSCAPRLYAIKEGKAVPTTAQQILASSWGTRQPKEK